jgi:type IV secretion system protein VirB1
VIVPFALSLLLARCAARVGPVTMSAVVLYESGARPFAIGDNTARRSYFPTERADAVALARRLLGAGHNIDVGYAQVNSANFAAYGLDARSALDPCTNLAAGSRLLQRAYVDARRRYGAGDALVRALSAYNTGNYWAGMSYVRNVYRTAAELRFTGAARSLSTQHRMQPGRRFVPLRRGRAWHGATP